ncbi:MAG: BrnA antitoxin family protein [Spirochaetales bacterium]
MAIIKSTITPNQEPTAKQLEEVKKASALPITYEDDCPLLTSEQLKEFAVIAKLQREERKKQVLSLRVSASTLKIAKTLGKGYTSVLSRLLDEAIKDAELLKKCL